MSEFELSELKGRKLMKEFLETRVDKVVFTKNLYARLDGYFRVCNKVASVEIKIRDKYYETFDTHLMEVGKYNAMVQDKEKHNLNSSFYACFFGDDTLYLYNISKVIDNSVIEKRKCPKTTAARSEYVWKDCYMIDRNVAVVFKKINGEWIRLEN